MISVARSSSDVAAKNLQISFIVPLIAYAYVAFYGLKGHKVWRNLATL